MSDDAIGRANGCLFCFRADGGFTSPEHVIPQSLGNGGMVLEPGVVCDRCNHGPLSVVDKALCDFKPLMALRTVFGIKAKSGRVPVTRFDGGTVTHDEPGHISINVDRASDTSTWRETGREGGHIQMQLQVGGGRRLNARYASELSRALLKSALECAWLDHGERSFDPEFDHVRDAVLGVPFDSYFAFARHGEPGDGTLELSYFLPEGGGLLVGASYFGMCFATASSPSGNVTIPATDHVAQVFAFRTSDFRDRRGRPQN